MVIYEVNLAIDKDIYSQFHAWLKTHAKEMLQFHGFIQASILKLEEKEISAQEKLTVQYQLTDREALEMYFTEFAPKMRESGITLFKDKFTAERKVFEVLEVLK